MLAGRTIRTSPSRRLWRGRLRRSVRTPTCSWGPGRVRSDSSCWTGIPFLGWLAEQGPGGRRMVVVSRRDGALVSSPDLALCRPSRLDVT